MKGISILTWEYLIWLVSIRTRPGGRVKDQTQANRAKLGESFNPHPPRRAGERVGRLSDCGSGARRFNPHPPRRAGESYLALCAAS